MPSTLKRFQHSGQSHFVTFGCYHRRLLLTTDYARTTFEVALNIRNHAQFVEKLRYIHRNPVRRGLCLVATDWKWSSFRHYATAEDGRVEIESEWTAVKRERAAGRLGPAVPLPHSSQKQA